MGSLDASNSSVATLPNTDSVVARTPTLRSQYAVPLVQDTTAETSTLGPLTSEVAKPGLTTLTSSTNDEPPHSAEQDDVESQTSSSSAKASGRNRKAPARYGSPIRLSVKEVEESAASSAMPSQVGDSSPVTPKRRFIRRNSEDLAQSSLSTINNLQKGLFSRINQSQYKIFLKLTTNFL